VSDDRGILYCEVGGERYALRSRDVRHVERAEHLRPADVADGRAGVLKLGDHIVPVFSLARVLGRPADRPARPEDHIAVTGDRESLVGWLVDRVVRTDHVTTADMAPLPALIGAPATTWFEGFLGRTAYDAAPVLVPQSLNPLAPATAQRTATTTQSAAVHTTGEPVAVVFSTTMLPPTGARRYALSGRQIVGIVPPVPAIPLPGCADHVVGVTWWRRSVVPVIDFRDPDDRATDTHRRRLIVRCGARHGGAPVAFSIDAEVLMCRADHGHRQLHDVPCPSFASGIFEINGESVALLDLDVLLDAGASSPGNGDPVLPDLLVERAAGNAEALCRPLDPPAFSP
jgi:chemotaxis signal transduction protein